VLWFYLAIAGAGSLAIRYIASAQVSRERGTSVLEEFLFGWRKAELLGLPAPYLYYACFYVVCIVGFLVTRS
jgi:hypothetical protein